MNREDLYVSLWGRRFYPSRLKLRGGVVVTHAADRGEIGTRGKYRGKKVPFGSCHVFPKTNGRKIAFLADHLRRNSRRYKAAGVTHIVFWILWRGGQGNTELTVRELAKLAAARVSLAMDYIWIEEEPNRAPAPTSGTHL